MDTERIAGLLMKNYLDAMHKEIEAPVMVNTYDYYMSIAIIKTMYDLMNNKEETK